MKFFLALVQRLLFWSMQQYAEQIWSLVLVFLLFDLMEHVKENEKTCSAKYLFN